MLLGSLISSLLLVVALAIFNITIKEVLLSSAARESQFAFYAADTGIECALNWDFNYNGTDSAFATSTDSIPPGDGVDCVGEDIATTWSITNDANAATTTFELIVGDGCVDVEVAKFGFPSQTRIESRGHNTCDTDNPRRVERAIFVSY